MGSWNDFNDAQSNTNLIPKGTLAKVRLTIRPGGFDDAAQGWTSAGGDMSAVSSVRLFFGASRFMRVRCPQA